MFENMIDPMFKDEYEFYVFDTAPTANARRLLGMSKAYPLGGEDAEEPRGGKIAEGYFPSRKRKKTLSWITY